MIVSKNSKQRVLDSRYDPCSLRESKKKKNEIQNTSCTVTSTQELMISLYDFGRIFKHKFTVGSSTPYFFENKKRKL
jgi:hypothetical protein